MADVPVIFMQLTQSQYNGITQKDNGTLYFCTDTKNIYLGSKKYGGSEIMVDDALSDNSTNPVQNKAISSAIGQKADISHASTQKIHGIGDATHYGHLMLSNSTALNYGVSSGVAATPSAVKSAYDLANGKAKENHAAINGTYGYGTGQYYGHVKLSDSIDDSYSSTSNAVAATPKAVNSVYSKLNSQLGSYKILTGWNEVTYKNTSYTNTYIAFGSTFTSKPVVIIGQPFNGVICTVFQDAVTTTGFTVNVPAVGSATPATRLMAWIAIGE